jgi:hypothetical protein
VSLFSGRCIKIENESARRETAHTLGHLRSFDQMSLANEQITYEFVLLRQPLLYFQSSCLGKWKGTYGKEGDLRKKGSWSSLWPPLEW